VWVAHLTMVGVKVADRIAGRGQGAA
jgi:hypothetical protein